jgi:hypothetical protein
VFELQGISKIYKAAVDKVDQFGTCNERSCDRDSLLLAARELLWHITSSMREVNALKGRGNSLASFCARYPPHTAKQLRRSRQH